MVQFDGYRAAFVCKEEEKMEKIESESETSEKSADRMKINMVWPLIKRESNSSVRAEGEADVSVHINFHVLLWGISLQGRDAALLNLYTTN